jgi:hypothetical protein
MPAPSLVGALSADESIPASGVPDRGADPAVVAIDLGGQARCGGALIAPDVVLTALRCVVSPQPTTCPARAPQIAGTLMPQSLRILVGDQWATAEERARGRDIVARPGYEPCGADIALVVLDAPIDDIEPLSVRPTGSAKGDHLRTTGFGHLGNSWVVDKIVRDHLSVLDTTATELWIGETCAGSPGGPALDESTGDIVAVASRPDGPSCGGAHAIDVYTRADAFLSLIGEALAKSGATMGPGRGRKKTKKGPLDMGANCVRGADCAAGVCATDRSHEYCSRTCQLHDRCPAHFRCQMSAQGGQVCAQQ